MLTICIPVPIMFYSDEDEDDGRLIIVDSSEDKNNVENEDDDVQPPGSTEPEAEGGTFIAAWKDVSLSPLISSRSVIKSEHFPEIATNISSLSASPVSASQPSQESRISPHPFPVQSPAIPRIQRNDSPPMVGDEREAQSSSADRPSRSAQEKVADVFAGVRPPRRRPCSHSPAKRKRPGSANSNAGTESQSSLIDAMSDNEVGAIPRLPQPLRPIRMMKTSSAPASTPRLLPHPRAPLGHRPLPIPPLTSADPARRYDAKVQERRGNRLRPSGVEVTLQPSSDVLTGVPDKRRPVPPLNSYNSIPVHTPEVERVKKLSHQVSDSGLSTKFNRTSHDAIVCLPMAMTRSMPTPQGKKILELPMTLQEVIEWNRNRRLSSPSSGSSSRKTSSSSGAVFNANIGLESANIEGDESGKKELSLDPLRLEGGDSGLGTDWEDFGIIPISVHRDSSFASSSSESSTAATSTATLFSSSPGANGNASNDTRSNTTLLDPDVGPPGPASHEPMGDFRARDSEEREAKVTETPAPGARDPHVPMDNILLNMLSEVLKNSKRRKALEDLRDGCAQLMVDFLHSVSSPAFSLSFLDVHILTLLVSQILLRSELLVPWLRKHTIIALYKLCRTSTLYPRCYVLKGITRNSVPDNMGGFCDIYKGHYGGQCICLKVLRAPQNMDNTLKVCFCLRDSRWDMTDGTTPRPPRRRPSFGDNFTTQTFCRSVAFTTWMRVGNRYV